MTSDADRVEEWQDEMLASYPENDGEKAIEFVLNSHPSRLVLDHGVHCTCCGRREDDGVGLISNPELPRVICMECYTWALLELKDRAAENRATNDENEEGDRTDLSD